jgi:hypothetical protein
MTKPVTFEVEVPKSHPWVGRLATAARALPQLEVTGKSGVSFTKRQVYVPGVYEEFFDALGEVIGRQNADDMLSALLPRNRLQDASQEALMGLAANLQAGPLLGALKMLGR